MPTFTSPTTNRSTGFVPDSTEWNRDVVTNLKALNFSGAKSERHDALSVASGTITAVEFDESDEYDTDSIHNPASTASENFVIPAGGGGRWRFDGRIAWASVGNTALRGFLFRVNGSTASDRWIEFTGASAATNPKWQSGGVTLLLSSGDTVSMHVLHHYAVNATLTEAWMACNREGTTAGYSPGYTPVAEATLGHVVTAAEWNTVMGNMKWLNARPSVSARRTAALTTTENVVTTIEMTASDLWDTHSMHNPSSTDPEFITLPTRGIYRVEAHAEWSTKFVASNRIVSAVRCTSSGGSVEGLNIFGNAPLNTFQRHRQSGQVYFAAEANEKIKFTCVQEGGSTTLQLTKFNGAVHWIGGAHE